MKKDVTEPAVYAVVLALLLGYRLMDKLAQPRKATRGRRRWAEGV